MTTIPVKKMSGEKQRLLAVGLMLLWCAFLIGCRMHATGGMNGIWLLWNLFLACVPLFWSYVFRWADAGHRPIWGLISFTVWLLFLPNAPYILTDLIHLAPRADVPLWFVLAMLLSSAGTGTLLGYHSLLNVQGVIERRVNVAAGWVVAVGALMLCGFGIYLGRFLRWNSWDAFTKPILLGQTVIGQFIDPGPHPHPLGVTVVFGAGLIVGYLALRALAPGHEKG